MANTKKKLQVLTVETMYNNPEVMKYHVYSYIWTFNSKYGRWYEFWFLTDIVIGKNVIVSGNSDTTCYKYCSFQNGEYF